MHVKARGVASYFTFVLWRLVLEVLAGSIARR
jgi:hypothetical protein